MNGVYIEYAESFFTRYIISFVLTITRNIIVVQPLPLSDKLPNCIYIFSPTWPRAYAANCRNRARPLRRFFIDTFVAIYLRSPGKRWQNDVRFFVQTADRIRHNSYCYYVLAPTIVTSGRSITSRLAT